MTRATRPNMQNFEDLADDISEGALAVILAATLIGGVCGLYETAKKFDELSSQRHEMSAYNPRPHYFSG